MNKTVNINLGGILFHIDEDAYQKLNRYFEAIKRSLTNSSGQDEIIKDIEIRVSELLTEKQKTEKHVVGIKDVEEVIAAIMIIIPPINFANTPRITIIKSPSELPRFLP